MKYNKHVSARQTPQSEPIPGKDMIQNNAGGFAFGIDKWTQLNRFLILGTEGGSYYVNEREMTRANAKSVIECIKEDGMQVVTEVVTISEAGRAPKNDPALFVLAMCAGLGDKNTRRLAFGVLPRVARIGTHLFHFAEYMEAFRGWGPMARKGMGAWYTDKELDQLAYQMTKYQSRDGWSHRDILRLAHIKPTNDAMNSLFKWATGTDVSMDVLPEIVQGFEMAKRAETEGAIIDLIHDYGLTREMIPSQFLNKPTVQLAMLQKGMPMTALIRNLGNLSKSGLLGDGKWDVTKAVVNQITNEEALHKARVHPIQILMALKIYAQGQGMRGRGTWDVSQDIVSALDKAFYLSFKNVEPTGKRHLLGLDVSGSMGGGYYNLSMGGLRPCEISAAMSMVRYRIEDKVLVRGFAHKFVDLGIGKTDRLDTVVDKVVKRNFGGTDCALPMIYAQKNNIEIDVFEVYTDSETWFGDIHPVQALDKYRQKTGIPAKLVVVAATATEFSIADPDDAGMLDVAGFDASVPNIIHQFATGSL